MSGDAENQALVKKPSVHRTSRLETCRCCSCLQRDSLQQAYKDLVIVFEHGDYCLHIRLPSLLAGAVGIKAIWRSIQYLASVVLGSESCHWWIYDRHSFVGSKKKNMHGNPGTPISPRLGPEARRIIVNYNIVQYPGSQNICGSHLGGHLCLILGYLGSL